MLWQMKKKRKVSRLGLFLFLVLLLEQLLPFLYANTNQTYQISEEDLTKLEENLTQLQTQFNKQEKIRLSLVSQLENANSELVSAKTSLEELESKMKKEMNRKLYTGIGIGIGISGIIALIVGLSISLSK